LLILSSLLLWLALVRELVAFVPPKVRLYDEMAISLPSLAQQVIAASRWFADYWWVIAVTGFIAVPVVALLSVVARHCLEWRAPVAVEP